MRFLLVLKTANRFLLTTDVYLNFGKNYRTTRLVVHVLVRLARTSKKNVRMIVCTSFCLASIRSSITDVKPLPDLYQVYSRVIHEEQNLNASRSKDLVKTDAVSFSVQSSVSPRVTLPNTSLSRDRSTLLCTHYHHKGHELTECFLVHGYPDWWLEQNRQDNQSSLRGRGSHRGGNTNQGGGRGLSRGRGRVNTAHVSTTSLSTNCNDQISQLISLLQAQRPNTSSERLSGRF
ncbi:PREDICTED: uncharacterized protein LOC104724690 [Camelina sativa]|uniref:Uncharacterized protein LOC104724690 n=1 Tax=Camelina sativa TaxID=90675 RepID=A0ABM0UI84_CAMSA|nr:PREDICTED: uncharacterized protein LOC104724690 [Camelina sativa]